jgi:hypothetical protein
MFNHLISFANQHEGHFELFIEDKIPDQVVGRMPIRDSMKNPFGTVHAGALIWLADVTAEQNYRVTPFNKRLTTFSVFSEETFLRTSRNSGYSPLMWLNSFWVRTKISQ